MQPQCLKLRSQHIVAVREDDSEEITKNTEVNLEEDTTNDASEEGEIPPKEEENLNELEYKANYVHFISNKDTEQ